MRIRLRPMLYLSLFITDLAAAQSAYDLAQRAADVIGIGRNGACSSCHATQSKQTLTRWSAAVERVQKCLDDESSGNAIAQLSCIAETPSEQNWSVRPRQLGFFSAGMNYYPIKNTLIDAYGPEKANAVLTSLHDSVAMPLRSPKPLSADDFSATLRWFRWGMPYLDLILNPNDGPKVCTESFSPDLKTHLVTMDQKGWQQRNQERGLLMFGCETNGQNCFQQRRNGIEIFPELSRLEGKQQWNADPRFHIHELHESDDETNYWIRSSADGRFVAYGGSPSGIIDLQSKLSGRDRLIRVNAYYDPGFFPDDSAFVFQGRGTGICNMSLIKNPRTNLITFREDACALNDQTQIPLYQAVGASLDGSDYLAVSGEFMSDPGDGSGPAPDEVFEASLQMDPQSKLHLYPIEYNGDTWVKKDPQTFDTPWEIDWGLAPSNRMVASRVVAPIEGKLKQFGYQLYGLQREADGQEKGRYKKAPYASLCIDGLKGNFSYDDRFFVTYSYIKAEHYQLLGYKSPDDSEFQARLKAGAANLFLYDLWSRELVPLTHMGEQQFALFPHFRSDGWIYFMVFDAAANKRYYLASDAAVALKRTQPTVLK